MRYCNSDLCNVVCKLTKATLCRMSKTVHLYHVIVYNISNVTDVGTFFIKHI